MSAAGGMRRTAAAVAIVLGGLSPLLTAGGVFYAYRSTRLLGSRIDWAGLPWLLWPLAFVAVGTLLALARPEILVGWGLLIVGFVTTLAVFGSGYAGYSKLSGASLPLTNAAIWLSMVSAGVATTMAPLVVSRLPSGRPDGRLARLVSRASWVLGAALVVWWGFGNELLSINTLSSDFVATPDLENPLALVHPSRSVTSAITGNLSIALVVCLLFSIGLVLARRRRASIVERAQLRWLGLGLLTLPLGIALSNMISIALPSTSTASDVVFGTSIVVGAAAVPVSIAVSVSRFRLFEIDRIISRTVAFSVVALVVGGAYALLATLPSLMIGGSSPTPSWVVAASTLAAFALFSPLRRRVQRLVDRRFNRSRYDAERVIEVFASRVRGFTEVGAITSGLTDAVQGALQPAGVAVWMRGPDS